MGAAAVRATMAAEVSRAAKSRIGTAQTLYPTVTVPVM